MKKREAEEWFIGRRGGTGGGVMKEDNRVTKEREERDVDLLE